MGITYGDHLIDSGANDITLEQEREIETREECDLKDHLPLRYEDTPDYCEVFDKNGEKVALTAQPRLFRALELRIKQLEFAGSTRETILSERLANAVRVLEMCQDCICGESPEDMTHEEAKEYVISKIRAVIFEEIFR
ncbi:hypothetical protein CO683_00940 [Bradyrhizobium ottawaense]|uniref:hypothetical protein n=1 Tax=Bradyrhizobium ottawaense TaxID=931866 RepID=UPI000BE90589|nr:hypothetical protein [Bradyrhizobium ottawaense]PDT71757.1 hypothetical protein CO683_00940 [Bradyrhizobium ottawaense]